MAPNALWLVILFDFGEVGVAVLSAMMIVAVWRMRRNSQMSALLLPFFIATLVNSTGADIALVALGIMLFAFRWVPTAIPFRPRGQVIKYDTGLFQEP